MVLRQPGAHTFRDAARSYSYRARQPMDLAGRPELARRPCQSPSADAIKHLGQHGTVMFGSGIGWRISASKPDIPPHFADGPTGGNQRTSPRKWLISSTNGRQRSGVISGTSPHIYVTCHDKSCGRIIHGGSCILQPAFRAQTSHCRWPR